LGGLHNTVLANPNRTTVKEQPQVSRQWDLTLQQRMAWSDVMERAINAA